MLSSRVNRRPALEYVVQSLHLLFLFFSMPVWLSLPEAPWTEDQSGVCFIIDNEDKWRNLSGGGTGSGGRDIAKTPMSGGVTSNQPLSSPEPLSVVPLVELGSTAGPSRTSVEKRTPPDYEALIFYALRFLGNGDGSDTNEILNYIEETFDIPLNYRRWVTSHLRKLVLAGKLVMVNNRYKINCSFADAQTSQQQADEAPTAAEDIPTETLEDASLVAAHLVAAAENMEGEKLKVCKRKDMLAELLQESTNMLNLAQELHQQCLVNGMVVLKP